MKKKVLIASIVAILIILGLVLTRDKQEMVTDKTRITYYEYFDTKIDIVFYEKVDESLNEKIAVRLKEIHDLTSNFDEDALLYKLNKEQSIEYDAELASILEFAIGYYNNYSNEFNIALGPVIDVWKGYLNLCTNENDCKLPTEEELATASLNIDPNNIVIDEDISIEKNMKLDLGSIAKGYAADEVNKLLKDLGYKHYLIDAGGNIVVTTKQSGEPFRVSIVNPTDTTKTFLLLNVENNAVVTSGDYERYFEVEGIRYSHLISNKTLYPSRNFKSVTVITNSSMKADVWTTMLFSLSYDDGLKLVEAESDLEAVWYSSDKVIYKSSGVVNYEEE